jgi:hypothetical protein
MAGRPSAKPCAITNVSYLLTWGQCHDHFTKVKQTVIYASPSPQSRHRGIPTCLQAATLLACVGEPVLSVGCIIDQRAARMNRCEHHYPCGSWRSSDGPRRPQQTLRAVEELPAAVVRPRPTLFVAPMGCRQLVVYCGAYYCNHKKISGYLFEPSKPPGVGICLLPCFCIQYLWRRQQ